MDATAGTSPLETAPGLPPRSSSNESAAVAAGNPLEHSLRSWGAQLPIEDDIEAAPNVPLAYPGHREMVLPAYTALVVKSLRNINAHDQTVDLSCTLVVRINFGNLPQALRDELTKSLAFRLNEAPLRYDSEHADAKWKGSLYVMTMRIQLPGIIFVGESFDYSVWKEFPFDLPRLAFRLEFTSHTVENSQLLNGLLKGWKARYNIHEYLGPPSDTSTRLQRVQAMMSFKSNADSLAAFDIRMAELAVSFTKERKTQDGKTFSYFAVVTHHIPLFRHPAGPREYYIRTRRPCCSLLECVCSNLYSGSPIHGLPAAGDR